MSLRTMCCICVNLNINQSSMPLLLTNFMILAWLVHNMSIHGGEETWSMTLTDMCINLENTGNQFPGKQINKSNKGKYLSKVKFFATATNKNRLISVLVYSVGDDGKPDEILNTENLVYKLKKGTHALEADLNSLNIEYIGFAHTNSVFKDKKVREAFNLAIDRNQIVERDLNGDVIAVEYGFIPYMTGYPIEKIRGHQHNVAKAKSLMAEAGYPDGRDFPVVDYYVNSAENSASFKMAEAVVKSLKENLNITVKIIKVSYQEREDAVKSGKAAMWRSGWLADYPDPENFLNIFVGSDETQEIAAINPFKYNSQEFNDLFERAKRETNGEERMRLYAACDQLIIDDAVVMPLFYKDFITMVNLKAKKFETNQMERLDFTRVYIKELVTN